MIEHDQLIRLRIRQRLQQHAVDDAEDGGVGADADRQGQDGDSGEHRQLDQPPQDVAQTHTE
jgi:hypothetical protein